MIAFMQTLRQPAPLLAHGLIQCLDSLPQFQPVATGPGIARYRRLTLGAFWPGGLVPRLPPPDCFALPLAPLWCPSFGLVAHDLPPIVCFVQARIVPRACAPARIARVTPPQPRRCSPVAARGQCWPASQTLLAGGTSSPPAPIWSPGSVPALSGPALKKPPDSFGTPETVPAVPDW